MKRRSTFNQPNDDPQKSEMIELECENCSKKYKEEDTVQCYVCKEYNHIDCQLQAEQLNDSVVMDSIRRKNSLVKYICAVCDYDWDIFGGDFANQMRQLMKKLTEKVENLEMKIESREEKNTNTHEEQQQLTWSQVVTINPKNNRESRKINVKEKVRSAIDPQEFRASTMKATASGGVRFKCQTEKNQNLEDDIKQKLGKNFVVNIVEDRKPSVKITGLFDDKNLNEEQLEECIRNQNSSILNHEDHIKVIKIIPAKNNKSLKTIIADTNSSAYDKLIEAKKVNVSWSRCSVLNAVCVMRCYKCSRYSHRGSVCKNDDCCPKCSLPHNLKDHDENIHLDVKCVNCVEHNKKLKLGLDENHAAWDPACEVYKRKLTTLKKSLNVS
jgi:hypothetical protein